MRIGERQPRSKDEVAVETERWVQLATRIPKALHKALKVHCVRTETTLTRFVVVALSDKLRRAGRGGDDPATRSR